MASSDQYEQALRDCQRTVMGNKKVDIETATAQDIRNAANFHGSENIPGASSASRGRNSGGNAGGYGGGHSSAPRARERSPPRNDRYPPKARDDAKNDSNILLMKGLPFDATTGDIEEFFEWFRIKDIEPVVPGQGQTNKGEAYVEMASARDCASAIREKNNHYIGDRYIQIFPATRAEMEKRTS